MLGDLTQFNPTENQERVINAYEASDCMCNVSELCKAGGISRPTFYAWLDDPDFRAYWEDRREKRAVLAVGVADRGMRASAAGKNKDVNVAACKLILERFDKNYAPRAKQEIELTGNDALLDAQIGRAHV